MSKVGGAHKRKSSKRKSSAHRLSSRKSASRRRSGKHHKLGGAARRHKKSPDIHAPPLRELRSQAAALGIPLSKDGHRKSSDKLRRAIKYRRA